MTRNSAFLAFAAVVALASCLQVCNAQGLKGGAQMPREIPGRLTYVPGANDQERWKGFLDVQPKLVGMSLNDVYKRFGKNPVAEKDKSSVEYGLTQEPVKSGTRGNSWLHLKIYFRNDAVWKYAVEAVQ